jgi:hypothetical protein
MLKWIEIIASFFIGKMQPTQGPGLRETAIALFEEITYKSRKTVSLVVISFAAAIFALGGFFISLLNATMQYDRDGVITFTSTFISGLVLIAIAVGTFAWVFGSAWPGTKKFKGLEMHGPKHHAHEPLPHELPERPLHQPSSLEQALSALVMDFVKERELRRSESAAALSPLAEVPDFRPTTTKTGANGLNAMPPLSPSFDNLDPIH